MSYVSWHNYGYGICTDDLGDLTVERIEALLEGTPILKKHMAEWFEKEEIQEPDVDDYLEFVQTGDYGIASILQEAIQEEEGIIFTACSDYDGGTYLIYQPSYPWYLPECEMGLTEERIRETLSKYVSIISDKQVTIDYQEVENGG